MSEIYRTSSQFAYLDIYGGVADAPPTVFCDSPEQENDGALVVNGPVVIEGAQRWTATVGLPHTQHVGELDVVWTFTMDGQPVTKTDHYEVVVPLVEIGDIRDELSLDADTTDDQIVRAERRARRIIENVVGQKFEPTTETLYVNSSNDVSLRMPKRLLSVTKINYDGLNAGAAAYRIERDGWGLRRVGYSYDSNDPALVFHSGVPIVDPYYASRGYWRGGRQIAITGRWGWDRVPLPIYEAALILIEERLCPDTVYRDRYIKTMTAADWRIEFDSGVYGGTGNVVADQILANFRVNSMAVV